jgi:hypothetical protein
VSKGLEAGLAKEGQTFYITFYSISLGSRVVAVPVDPQENAATTLMFYANMKRVRF